MGAKIAIAKCPKCGEAMSHSGTMTTLLGFISPAGHNHDDNCRTRNYFCKCGYSEIVSKRNKCQACDWVGKETCFCHIGKKVDTWPEDIIL